MDIAQQCKESIRLVKIKTCGRESTSVVKKAV